MGLSIPSQTFIKFLESKGFISKDSEGSHNQYEHPITGCKVTVQHPVKDIKLLNLFSMLRQAGLNKKDLLKFLGR